MNKHKIGKRYMEISLSNIRNNNSKENEKIDLDDVPLDCTTAFVKNLSYYMTEKEVDEKFKTCGDINEIRFVYEPQTNKFKGFCYIDFKEHKGLLKALKLNGTFFGGRKLYVYYEQGKPKKLYKTYEESNTEDVSLLNRKRY
jgi:RNA recognition motif-containing protein